MVMFTFRIILLLICILGIISTPIGCQYSYHYGPEWLLEPAGYSHPNVKRGGVIDVTAMLLMLSFVGISVLVLFDEFRPHNV